MARASETLGHFRIRWRPHAEVSRWIGLLRGGGELTDVEVERHLADLGGALWRRGATGDEPGIRRGRNDSERLADAFYRAARRYRVPRTGSRPSVSARNLVRRLAMACERAVARFEKANNRWWLQPRLPRGRPEGGQWTDGGASGGNRSRGALSAPQPPAPPPPGRAPRARTWPARSRWIACRAAGTATNSRADRSRRRSRGGTGWTR